MRREIFILLSLILFSVFLSSVNADNITLRNNVTETLEDTYVNGASPTTNYAHDGSLYVDSATPKYIYLKFNLSQLTQNCLGNACDIINATLNLNESTDGEVNLAVQECSNQTWTETEITWGSQTKLLASCNSTTEWFQWLGAVNKVFYNWTVTYGVQKNFNSGNKNVTWLMSTGAGGGSGDFFSADTDASNGKPYLTIHYTQKFSVGYDTNTLSGNSNTITFDIINKSIINNATLIWNGTAYESTASKSDDTFTYTSTFINPTLVNNTNVTLYWSVFSNGIRYNTTNYTQSILVVGMDNCSSYTTKAMTFTLYNESTLGTMYGTLELVFNMFLNENITSTYSTKFVGNYSYSICLSTPATNYTFDGYMSYYNNSGYTTRTYWFYHAPLNNVTQNISLYLITTGESEEVTFTIKDSVGYPYPNLYVNLQRFFPALNSYNTIQIGKSDSNGLLATYLIPYSVYYKMVLMDGNTILQTYSPFLITSNSMSFNVNTSYGSYLYKYFDKIAYSCSYNNVSLYFTCTITDTSGEVTRCFLDVMTVNTTHDEHILSVNGTSSSMTIGGYLGNTTGKTYFYSLYCNLRQGKTILERDFMSGGSMTIIPPVPIYGLEGVFLSFMIVGTLAFIGFYINPMLGMIMMFVGLLGCVAFGLIAAMGGVIFSLILVGVIVLWRIETL